MECLDKKLEAFEDHFHGDQCAEHADQAFHYVHAGLADLAQQHGSEHDDDRRCDPCDDDGDE